MSARTKKTTTTVVTTKTTAAASPAQSLSFSESSRPARPLSPTMISRVQEKNELASLNDRLATYIDKVRQLESENSRLSRMVQTQEETVTKEVSGIKGLYEGELISARKLLDELAKDKAKLQFENGKLKTELEDLRARLRAKENDFAASEKKLLTAESQVNELQARLNDAVNQRRYWEDEFNKVKKDNDALTKSLATAKKQLEDETIKRVDLENRIQSLKEELAFRSQVFEQERNESLHRSRVVVEETDGRLESDYDSRLCDALKEMRQEMEEQIRQNRDEAEAVFEKRLAEMKELAARSVDGSDKTDGELRNSRRRIEELSAEISRINAQSQASDARIRDLENQLHRERDDHAADRNTLNAEIQRLRKAVEDQLNEYRDLMDVKIQLDAEIAAYRKLLESEETRLNLSAVGSTPGRTPDSGRKRKRTDLDVTDSDAGSSKSVVRESQSNAEYSVSSAAKDVVEISETNSEQKYIKLFNTSADKDVSLAGWQLKHACGGQESTLKFHRTLCIKPQQTITIWGSDSNQTHTPPSNLVMKDQTIYTGDDMKTTLLDNKGEEMASLTMQRAQLRTSSMFVRSAAEESSSVSVEQTQEKRKSWGWPSLFNVLK